MQPKEEVKAERDVRRTVKMITEVWMKVGIEKLDNHKEVTVKALFVMNCQFRPLTSYHS